MLYSAAVLAACVGLAHAQAEGVPPAPVLLNATKSGVLPVEPTPFNGVETEEGAIIYDGPPNPGFAGLNGPAVAQTNMPMATYAATLPGTMFDPYAGSNITGSVLAVGTAAGVEFTVNFTGIPSSMYGPFVYHVHGLAVPADGNCTETLGHLDPTDRGEYFPCDVSQPQTCQAGDLAGKHGNITGSTFMVKYVEPYLSTDPSSAYYFGDKSIVIHTSNTTRLTCANFAQVGMAGMAGGNGSSSSSMSMSMGMSMSSMMSTSTAMGSGASMSGTMMTTTTASSPSSVATAGAGVVAVALPGVLAAWAAACLLLV